MRRLLAALAAALLPLAAPAETPVLVGSFHWIYPKSYFGGFSGIDIAENGIDFMTIGDAGQIVRGRLQRAGDRVVGVDFDLVKSLHTPEGRRVTGTFEFDAEGFAMTSEGSYYVSFEAFARVWYYSEWLGPAEALPRHPDFDQLRHNQGLEALAIGLDGALYTLPELPPSGLGPRTVYKFKNGAWEEFGQIRTDRFYWPVGADIGADGSFYLLERRFFPVLGFSSRVRRFRLGPEGLYDGETLLETPIGRHDNLEGIAVWEDAEGRVRLTMISDDNRSASQRTEIVEYALPALAQDVGTR